MKKIIISLCSLLIIAVASAQVPRGINYQALASDGSGVPLKQALIKVKIALLSDTLAPVVVWEELHDQVKTNLYGVFSLVIGSGIRQSGLVLNFGELNWEAAPLFLRTQIFYQNNWKTMGISKLWSVPYSLVSSGIDGPFKKIEVIGEDEKSEDALFEIKRKDGQTIFAVYNHGVRVFIPVDTLTKAKKGGFAIGGFDNGKGIIQDYFIVNADSIRGYFDSGTAKGGKGGFAIGGFDSSKASAEEYLRISDSSTTINIANRAKGSKGGFAIGSFDKSKGEPIPFVNLTPENYFIGHESGTSNTSGLYNSVIGYRAGKSNTAGFSNIFIGYESGFSNTLGRENTFVGYQAGYSNIGNDYPGVFQHGRYNCYFGYQAGFSGQHGDNNTLIGYKAGYNNQANFNTFIGSDAGLNTTMGGYNAFIGQSAGYFNTTGMSNVFLGHMAGYNNSDGEDNIYIGTVAGAAIRNGNRNVIVGREAGSGSVYSQTGTGSDNVFLGAGAGKYCTDGSANVFIGKSAGESETGSNLFIVDNSSTSTPLVYGNFNTNFFRINGNIEATGTIVSVSDAKLKTNITGINNALDKIKSLRGVYFDWNQNVSSGLLLPGNRQIGLIAQEVEEFFPELVAENDKGFKMVDYQRFTAILLEALKDQQQEIEEHRREIEELKNMVRSLLDTGICRDN